MPRPHAFTVMPVSFFSRKPYTRSGRLCGNKTRQKSQSTWSLPSDVRSRVAQTTPEQLLLHLWSSWHLPEVFAGETLEVGSLVWVGCIEDSACTTWDVPSLCVLLWGAPDAATSCCHRSRKMSVLEPAGNGPQLDGNGSFWSSTSSLGATCGLALKRPSSASRACLPWLSTFVAVSKCVSSCSQGLALASISSYEGQPKPSQR